jgi:DNA-binding GntR family transcriptional regulator
VQITNNHPDSTPGSGHWKDVHVLTVQAAEPAKATLRREIIFGQRPPGARLMENEIAERFGLGRHVVRTVFADLERMGLVERRPNRGVVVVEYSRAEIEHLYEMREILQRAAVLRIPMPVARAALAALINCNEAFLARLQGGDLDGAVEANNVFHRTLFDLCGNPFLARAVEDHWQRSAAIHSYAIGTPAMATESYHQHQAMIAALQAQDRECLAELCTEHMLPALRAYQKVHGGWTSPAPLTSAERQFP